jgi:hypothetical protein
MRQDVFRALNNAFSQFDYSRDLVDTGPVPFMTGVLKQDSFVYYAEQNYGVKLDINPRNLQAWTYKVVNEKQYTFFILRWM